MEKQLRKIRRYLGIIDEARTFNGRAIDGITILPCPYKEGTEIPPKGEFKPFNSGDVWGEGWDTHAWFHFTFTVPEEMRGKTTELVLRTDLTGWDAGNPQFMAYINGKLRQGLDTNHLYVTLDNDTVDYDCYIYG